MLKVHLLQTHLYWRDPGANIIHLSERLNAMELGQRDLESHHKLTHLVLLPEMFSTGFSMDPEGIASSWRKSDVVLSWMQKRAIEGGYYLGGSLMMKRGRRFYNMFVLCSPTRLVQTYAKRHLFGLAGEDQKYTRGNRRVVWEVEDIRICPQICYDLRFPVWSRNDLNYDLLVYVANWPSIRINAWNTLLAARAIENQAFVVGVNRIGIDGLSTAYPGSSQIIDPWGTVLGHAGDSDSVISAVIDCNTIADARSRLPFLKDADTFRILKVPKP
jgi:predicted amidohydrolase